MLNLVYVKRCFACNAHPKWNISPSDNHKPAFFIIIAFLFTRPCWSPQICQRLPTCAQIHELNTTVRWYRDKLGPAPTRPGFETTVTLPSEPCREVCPNVAACQINTDLIILPSSLSPRGQVFQRWTDAIEGASTLRAIHRPVPDRWRGDSTNIPISIQWYWHFLHKLS